MGDAQDPKHVQSFLKINVNPSWLLQDDQVNKMVDMIPDRAYRDFLTRHMLAAEKAAYDLGIQHSKTVAVKEDQVQPTATDDPVKMKQLLEHIYALREENPEEMALDGIPGHFLTDDMMQDIGRLLGLI